MLGIRTPFQRISQLKDPRLTAARSPASISGDDSEHMFYAPTEVWQLNVSNYKACIPSAGEIDGNDIREIGTVSKRVCSFVAVVYPKAGYVSK